ncbi:MAG TPA: flavin reductase family protein [Patescibacteria group bacterium]|nr:flavin reductase family protein [Patescibacteria group bacterium]
MKEKVSFDKTFMLAPVPVVLVACTHEELGRNLLTIAWCGVDCSDPPTIHVSVRPSRHSYRMIRESECFTVNIPTKNLLREVDLCGTVSGKFGDKFERSGLTPMPGTEVAAPIVAECPINLECRVREVIELGLHHMFIGEIVAKHADPDVLKDGDLDFHRIPLISYVHGEYWSLGERIGMYGFSRECAEK